MNDTARKNLLASLGLNADGDDLTPAVLAPAPVKAAMPAAADVLTPVYAPAPTGDPYAAEPVIADENDRTTPVQSIVFDDLSGHDLREFASRKALVEQLFARYRATGRNPERNKPLWARCTKHVEEARRAQATGGIVRETVKATAEQRDIAAILAAKGITAADLAELLAQA